MDPPQVFCVCDDVKGRQPFKILAGRSINDP